VEGVTADFEVLRLLNPLYPRANEFTGIRLLIAYIDTMIFMAIIFL
jgi:hypothetical protein